MEKTLNSRLLHEGRNLSFKTDEVQLQNGRRTRRDIVEHPGAVAIIPLLPDGRLVLVRQYRYAIRKMLLEIPAGTLEEGEDPLNCAVRELIEETGYEAGHMERIMNCYMAPGYSSESIQFYIASDLREVESEMDYDEAITVEKLALEEVLSMIDGNIIEDVKTIAGVFAYAHSLRERT